MNIKRAARAGGQGMKRRPPAPAKRVPGKGAPIKAATLERREARMEDVAKLAGVSAMTVSRALRNTATVTPDTLKRIEAAIDTTGYLPNRVAGSLSSRRTNVIGLIVPSLRNAVFVETIQGVADMLGQQFDLMIAHSGYTLEGEEAAVLAFLSQRVCGMILHNTKHTPKVRRMIKEAALPCVETGNLGPRPIEMAVGFSNRDAARAMTEHLIGRGYRRIGFVSLPLRDNDRAFERRAGYVAALEAHGIKPDPDRMLEASPGLDSGGKALVRLVERDPKIDAVFLTGDVLATGAVLEANRRGWKVPDRVAIAGSDDDEFQANVLPPLTSIRFPRYEIGRRAAGMVTDRVLGRSTGPAVLDLGYEIIQRAST
jgi:LacI family transcriptional regulator, gluconate utilization system Gnt-I transcriptional repressor